MLSDAARPDALGSARCLSTGQLHGITGQKNVDVVPFLRGGLRDKKCECRTSRILRPSRQMDKQLGHQNQRISPSTLHCGGLLLVRMERASGGDEVLVTHCGRATPGLVRQRG